MGVTVTVTSWPVPPRSGSHCRRRAGSGGRRRKGNHADESLSTVRWRCDCEAVVAASSRSHHDATRHVLVAKFHHIGGCSRVVEATGGRSTLGTRGIPREVVAFIHDHLSSVAQLDVLLLLHGEPERQWTAADVAGALRIDVAWARSELEGLDNRGLLRVDAETAYRYSPATPQLSSAVDGLARSYSTHRVSVVTTIFSRPSDSIGSFADAFKLRRTDDG